MLPFETEHYLCIGGGSRSAAVDSLVHFCKLVSDSVDDVGAGRGTRIGTDDNSAVEFDRHDRGSEIGGDLLDGAGRRSALMQRSGIGRQKGPRGIFNEHTRHVSEVEVFRFCVFDLNLKISKLNKSKIRQTSRKSYS